MLQEVRKDSHGEAQVIVSHHFMTNDKKGLKSLAAKINPKIKELEEDIQRLTDKIDSE